MAVPNLWRTKKQRYRLQGELCPVCQHTLFPPRQVCPHCQQGAIYNHVEAADGAVDAQPYMLIFSLPQAAELTIGDD